MTEIDGRCVCRADLRGGFKPHGDGTEVVVSRERIPDTATREQHEQGWLGCLDELMEYLQGAT